MTPARFVDHLASIRLPNVFNPYSDLCAVHDRSDALAVRRNNLMNYLMAARSRGGRRTGLALTDERHLLALAVVYSSSAMTQATTGPALAERTAAEIWAQLRCISLPPLLWNAFPFHPHVAGDSFTNRRYTSKELSAVDDVNRELLSWMKIRRVVAIGNDAAHYARRFAVEVCPVRHPSYGGIRAFRKGIGALYSINTSQLSLLS